MLSKILFTLLYVTKNLLGQAVVGSITKSDTGISEELNCNTMENKTKNYIYTEVSHADPNFDHI